MRKISENALIQRINRRIGGYDAKARTVWGERIRKARGWRDRSTGLYYENSDLGRFYAVDNWSNFVTDSHIDLEAMARELGALGPGEGLDQ